MSFLVQRLTRNFYRPLRVLMVACLLAWSVAGLIPLSWVVRSMAAALLPAVAAERVAVVVSVLLPATPAVQAAPLVLATGSNALNHANAPDSQQARRDWSINDASDPSMKLAPMLLGAVLPTDVLQPGYAIYTSQAYQADQPTLAVRDLRLLAQRYADPANLAGSAVDNSPSAPLKRTWNAAAFGGNPVMGVAIDERTREIYVGTSFLYNFGPLQPPYRNTMVAQVYRISRDGNTVELFATLPGSKGTGWLDIDVLHNQLYVSNLDDGLIYTISLGGGVGQTGPFATFAPHVADDSNESTAATQPDWHMAPLGERVLGVAFNATDARLYYSIWANDLHNTGLKDDPGYATTALFNTIRSVQIAPDGSFVPGTDLLEVTLPKMGIGFSMPVSDITFDAAGARMLLAEQGFDSINGWGAFAHTSRVLEYTGVSGAWVAEPLNKFAVGLCCGGPHNPNGTDSRGGVAFAPGGYTSAGDTVGSEDFIIATADSVADDYSIPDHHFYVDGAGFMPASGSFSPLAVAGLDLDGNRLDARKGAYGDIDVLDSPAPRHSYDLALVNVLNTTVAPGPFSTGSVVTFTLTIYNQGTQPVTDIQIVDIFPAGLTLNDPAWSSAGSGMATLVTPIPSLAPGASILVDISFTVNAASGTLTQYAEITALADSTGNPVVDADSSALLGAGNDPAQVDNYVYGTLAGEDHDDLDPATLDLGTVGLGNLVFIDTNGNRHFDGGEGQDGVTVLLLRPGYGPDGIAATADDHDPITSTLTAGGGHYAFSGLRPGGYVVVIPYPMFAAGALLEGYVTVVGSGADNGVDDNADENGIDPNNSNVPLLTVAGVSSNLINLVPGSEPVAEGGSDGAGDSPDADIDYTVDFGFFKGVGIGNLVWLDFNGNGKFDVGYNEGIDGIPVNLYRPGFGADGIAGTADDGDIVATTHTHDGGTYAFTNLEPGGYIVTIPPAVFANVGASILAKARSLPGNGADNGVDDDRDENGLDELNPAVDGISSALINLTAGAEPTTSETGKNGNTDTSDSDIDFTVDFGFAPLVGLGNTVWIDADNNGIYNTGEGINGVRMELYQPGFGPDRIPGNADDHDIVQTFTTLDIGLGAGLYYFAEYPGTYEVRIPASQFQVGGPLAGYVSLAPAGGDNQEDDDRGQNGRSVGDPAVTGVSSGLITLANNTEPIGETGRSFPVPSELDDHLDFTVDFGFVASATFGNFVWLESDGDGLASTGVITPLAGLLITATNGVNVYTTRTGHDGYYTFVVPAGVYMVTYAAPPIGMIASATPNDGAVDRVNQDTDQRSRPNNTVVVLTAGDVISTVDFGFFIPASLGDLVWYDANRNGIQDNLETGVSGVVVTLYAADGTQLATMTTDTHGYYRFDNLIPGGYYVEFQPPAGYIVSPLNTGTDDAFDSDADSTTLLRTPLTTLVSDEHNPTLDLGLALPTLPTAIGDRVWFDSNHDGVQDVGEPGLQGITVQLYTANNTLVASTQTDSTGYYMFNHLPAGDYSIQFVPPAGYLASPADQGGQDAADSDADTATGRTPVVTLVAGQPNPTVDAGFYVTGPAASLGNYVWFDRDADGVQDGDETGIPGIQVTLYTAAGQALASVQTDVAGYYRFDNLPVGDYFVEFNTHHTYVPSPQNAGDDDALDSDADRLTGRTTVTTLVAGENDTTWDAGFFLTDVKGVLIEPAVLGDRAWQDLDNDGIQDTGEPDVPGVVVKLYDGDGQLLATTITDANGEYLFPNLAPGEYAVEFIPPLGYLLSPQNQGSEPVILLPGETNLNLDVSIQLSPTNLGEEEEPGFMRDLFLPMISRQ